MLAVPRAPAAVFAVDGAEYIEKGLIPIKQGKNPTANQKKYLAEQLGMDPKAWLVVSWGRGTIVVQEKSTMAVKTIHQKP